MYLHIHIQMCPLDVFLYVFGQYVDVYISIRKSFSYTNYTLEKFPGDLWNYPKNKNKNPFLVCCLKGFTIERLL